MLIRRGCVQGRMHAESLQSCLTRAGSSVPGVLQAKILEWVVMPAPVALPDSGVKPASLMCSAWAGRFFTPVTPGKLLVP